MIELAKRTCHWATSKSFRNLVIAYSSLTDSGDGSYSSVYKVKRSEDGLEYALKKVKISHLSDREKENALNEVRILASIKHSNVASYKQAFFDEPSSSLW